MARLEYQEEMAPITTINQGTEITGDIISSSDIRIDGTINGNMDIKGKVVIGQSGRIKGSVTCKNLEVSGIVEGIVFCTQILSMKPSAKIFGDIKTVKMALEPGAIFTGNCIMTELDGQEETQNPKEPTRDLTKELPKDLSKEPTKDSKEKL